MNKYVIGLGSSLQNGSTMLTRAKSLISNHDQIVLTQTSNLYRSAARASINPFYYFNAGLFISTSLNPDRLWLWLMSVESRLGRVRSYKNAPRTIDLDILWSSFGNFKSKYLNLPHLELENRNFAAIPTLVLLNKVKHALSLDLAHCLAKMPGQIPLKVHSKHW